MAQLPPPNHADQPTHRVSDCSECGDSGWIRIVRDRVTGVAECICRKAKIKQSRLRSIPERFRDCSFENYRPKDDLEDRALAVMVANPGGSYLLHGRYGHGKTHLAVAQYRVLISAGELCMFLSMSEILLDLRKHGIDSSYFSQLLDRVQNAESFHLFIDDMDKFKPTEFKGEALFDLIDTVYRRKLAITVTTNLGLVGLIEMGRLDSSIVRRLDDICKAVEL